MVASGHHFNHDSGHPSKEQDRRHWNHDKFTTPLEAGHFRLPWHPDGDPHTGLSRECVAKCQWKVAIDYDAIEGRIGFTPPAIWDQIMAEILFQIKKKREDREPL